MVLRRYAPDRGPLTRRGTCHILRMRLVLAALSLAALSLAPRAARAQHDHGAHHGEGEHAGAPASSFSAALGVITAGYDAMLYRGDYQGLAATGRWARGRFDAALGVTGYRLQKNGKTVAGLGDLMLHGRATALRAGAVTAGAVAMVMMPTGDHDAGLGMGHVMLMPGGWVQWAPGRLALAASAGYARGLGGGDIHAAHGGGAWPLVDPMTSSELTFGASGMIALAASLRAGLRADGAVPTGSGDTRLAGGVRAVWTLGRVETTAELQGGLAGAPFDLRGLVEAAVRFD
jgi:hypothetical protein